MEQFELDVNYKASDFISAAIVYRKSAGDTRTFIVIIWILIAFVFVSYLMPFLLIPLLCIPFGTCSPQLLWDVARVTVIGAGGCLILLLAAYTNILYRLRMEFIYRIGFIRFKKEYQSTRKFITNEEGLQIRELSYKTTFYWKTFQQIIESQDAFLLPIKKNRYIVIPKRSFKSPDDMARFAEVITTYTNQQIKRV